MIKKYLEDAGLNATEAEIYLTLYEYRRLSASGISELTGIKRTTTYAAADELVKKGLANIEHGKNKRFYSIDSSKNLLSQIKKQEQEIINKKEAIKKAIKGLDEIPRSGAIFTPKIRLVTEANIEDFLYKQTPIWEKSMREKKDTTWWGLQDTSLVEFDKYKKWILWYWKRAPKIFNLKMFSNNADIEKEKPLRKIKRRMLRVWDRESAVTATHWILGDYIVSIVTNVKSPYLIQTHDPIMAHNMRELYKYTWETSHPKKIKKKTE